jgi:TolB protein
MKKKLFIIILSIFFSCQKLIEPLDIVVGNIEPPNSKSIIYVSNYNQMGDQVLISSDYKSSNILSGGSCENAEPSWSNDKQWIVFLKYFDIYFMLFKVRYDGKELRQLSPYAQYCLSPRWSQKGDKILYIGTELTNRSSKKECYIMDSSGNNITKITDQSIIPFWSDIVYVNVDWHNDGESVLLQYYRKNISPRQYSLGLLNSRTINFFEITKLNYLNPIMARISPKRDEIVFIGNHNNGRNGQIFMSDLNGNDVRVLTNEWECIYPAWSKDGESIIFSKRISISSSLDIWSMDRNGGKMKKLITNTPYDSVNPDW